MTSRNEYFTEKKNPLLSLGQPILLGFGPGLPGVPAADPTIAVTLGLMHVIAYAISVPMFIRIALD